MTKNKYENF